jgi:hypothetical protein
MGLGLVCLGVRCLFSQPRPVRSIPVACMVGSLCAPGLPTGAVAADIFHFNAIDGTDGQAQPTACAVFFDHGMHVFVAAINRVSGTHRQAQRTSNAPAFVDPSHVAWRLCAVCGVQWANRATRDGREPFNARLTAWRTLVDIGGFFSNRFGVMRTIRVPAARALRLRQCGQYAIAQAHVVFREALRVLAGTNFLLGVGLF